MIFTLAWRSLLSRPIRSAVLAGGFGLGVAVMVALLGIGGVILEQAQAPELVGGGDVVIGGATGRVANARFILSSVLGAGALAPRVAAASPALYANLYLLDADGATPLRARGGIPSRERALGDPEIEGISAWVDAPGDRSWAEPDAEDILRRMDRFHPIPDVPSRAGSWLEWLYFNGRSPEGRFYLTFLAGPRLETGKRTLGVRLQLERDGRLTSYSASAEVDDRALAAAPDLSVAGNAVRLVGTDYHLTLDLPAETAGSRATGTLVLRATPGRSLPPFEVRGAKGWVSGYVVPVISGELGGAIRVGSRTMDFEGGAGYHDHNWGFWEGVRWQWGQVQSADVSFVYGRVYPPADAADASRLPGFMVALGPEGPLGYATDLVIDEVNDPSSGRLQRIELRAGSDSLVLTMSVRIDQTTRTRMRAGFFGEGKDFLQMRGTYRVSGTVSGRAVEFTGAGSAETFR